MQATIEVPCDLLKRFQCWHPLTEDYTISIILIKNGFTWHSCSLAKNSPALQVIIIFLWSSPKTINIIKNKNVFNENDNKLEKIRMMASIVW